MTDKPDLTALAAEIHAENVAAGWWDTPGNKADLITTKMMLVITELSEAVEGDRKNLKDDHLPQHPMSHVELADAMIRLLDIAGFGRMAWVVPMHNNADLLNLLCDMPFPQMIYAAVGCISGPEYSGTQRISMGISYVRLIAEICDCDIWKIIEEKREYNRNRLDHKRSERVKTHGKKY